jgi:hypothetical protein
MQINNVRVIMLKIDYSWVVELELWGNMDIGNSQAKAEVSDWYWNQNRRHSPTTKQSRKKKIAESTNFSTLTAVYTNYSMCLFEWSN